MTNVIKLPINDNILRLLAFSPVTLITTVGKDGSTNAAPHSRATIADYDPPQIIISVNTNHDTYRNIIETGEFTLNISGTNMLRQIWIAQKHFPYGVSELEKTELTGFPAEKVRPPRIKECSVYIECNVLWTKITGSSCLVLGSVEAVSAKEEIGKLRAKELAVALNRPIFLSYQRREDAKNWMFAQIGRLHILTERNGEIEISSEAIK